MRRRAFLSRLAGGLAVLSGPAVLSLGASAADGMKTRWGYGGGLGPERWGALSPEFAACSEGALQSPIDIPTNAAAHAPLPAPRFAYKSNALRTHNTGHAARVNVDTGNIMTVGETRHELLYFKFHAPSEHMIDGEPFDLEVQFVHRELPGPASPPNAPEQLAVVSVMLRIQTLGASRAIAELLPHFTQRVTEEELAIQGVSFDPSRLLPTSRRSFRYFGSLTTPPCTEGVHWMVMTDWIGVGARQVEEFRRILDGTNARPVQPMGRRFLMLSE